MAKFKIQQKPTFVTDVQIPVIGDGDPVSVKFTFKALTRTQLAEMYDRWADKSKEISEFDYKNLAELAEQDMNNQVDRIQDIVAGWDIDDEFNDENIRKLVDLSVGVGDAIVDAFQGAYTKERSKN